MRYKFVAGERQHQCEQNPTSVVLWDLNNKAGLTSYETSPTDSSTNGFHDAACAKLEVSECFAAEMPSS